MDGRCRLAIVGFVMVFPIVTSTRADEIWGNYHTLGITIDVPSGVSVADVSEVRLYELGGVLPRRLLDPALVDDAGWFAASVFDLAPDTEYNFRADFLSINEKLLGRKEFSGKTRPEPGEPTLQPIEIHVSPSGDDCAPGTATRPKRTIAAAVKAATGGAHVVLHQGVYHEGSISLVRGGKHEAPLVIRSADDEEAIIDGSDPDAASNGWKDLGGGYFSRPFQTDTHLVSAEHVTKRARRRMYRIADRAGFENRRVGQYRFDQFDIREAYQYRDGVLTVYCPYFRPGGDVVIRASARGGAFELSKAARVVFADLSFRFFDGQAIYVNDSSDITIRRCRFEHVNTPIAVKRKSDRLLVEKCSFLDDCARWGFLPKASDGGNYSAWIETGAVYVHHPFDGRGLVVRDNLISGLFDGVHLVPSGASPRPHTSEIDFYRNTVTGVCDDFIEIDGFSRNVRVFDNKMRRCLSGISIAQAIDGPTYVVRNVIAGCGESVAAAGDGEQYLGRHARWLCLLA